MHRLMRTLIIAGVVGIPLVASTPATLAASTPLPAATVSAISLTGSVVGGVTHAGAGDPVTFLFTARNTGTTPISRDLVIMGLSGATLVNRSCVVPGGFLFTEDGYWCEPGALAQGRKISVIVNAAVSGLAGTTASARLCLADETTGRFGPCTTLSVAIG